MARPHLQESNKVWLVFEILHFDIFTEIKRSVAIACVCERECVCVCVCVCVCAKRRHGSRIQEENDVCFFWGSHHIYKRGNRTMCVARAKGYPLSVFNHNFALEEKRIISIAWRKKIVFSRTLPHSNPAPSNQTKRELSRNPPPCNPAPSNQKKIEVSLTPPTVFSLPLTKRR